MRGIKIAVLTVFSAALFAGAADAQKRPAKKKIVKKPAVTTTSTIAPLDVRTAREKVSIQLENVNRFVDVLGPIAQGIEDFDRTSGQQRPSTAAYGKNETNKQKVIAAIRNLRDGLSALESDFRTKPALQRYLRTISGITDLAAESEDSAIAGRFIASKEPLRNAARKLTDTLKVLPFTAGVAQNQTPMNVSDVQAQRYQVIKEPRVGDGPTFIVGTFRTKAEADRRAAQEAAKEENRNYRFLVEKVSD